MVSRIVISLLLLAAAAAPAAGQDFAQHFQGAKFDKKLFYFEGPDAQRFIKPEAEGLRWRFSEDKLPSRPVGIAWNFHVRGDFMATARYEFIATDQPQKARAYRSALQATAALGVATATWEEGAGLPAVASYALGSFDAGNFFMNGSGGVELYLMLDTPARDGIAFSRRWPDHELVFIHNATNKEGRRYARQYFHFIGDPRSHQGRLRLARDGATLIIARAEGPNAELQEIHRTDIGAMDVRMVRFAGLPGEKLFPLDMRLLSFELHQSPPVARKAIPPPGAPGAEPPAVDGVPAIEAQDPSDVLLGLGVAVAVAALVVVGSSVLLWIMWRKRKRATLEPDHIPSDDALAGIVKFDCAGCGKKLRVAEDSLGKRVKCPACGHTAEVFA